MNILKYVPQSVTRTGSRAMLKASKNAPQLLFVGGVVGAVGATVLACRATLKVEEVIDDHSKTMIDIKTVQHVNYGEQERKHDTALLYMQTTVKIVKLYGPAIILGSVSIGMLTKSHSLLNQRNAALSAAYAGLQATFDNYRERTQKELGEEREREIYNDVQVETAKGKKGSVELTKHVGAHGGSQYARFYDETNRNFVPGNNPEMNIMVLRQRENYLNDKLSRKGHLFLNEAYRELGFEDTTAGAVVGWIFDPQGRRKDGIVRENRVDLGIWADHNRDALVDFVVHGEGIFLDFNVDGEIYRLI